MLSCEPELVALPEATEEADVRRLSRVQDQPGATRESLSQKAKDGPSEYLPGMLETPASVSRILNKQIYLYR